jgi:hypothetical protein
VDLGFVVVLGHRVLPLFASLKLDEGGVGEDGPADGCVESA